MPFSKRLPSKTMTHLSSISIVGNFEKSHPSQANLCDHLEKNSQSEAPSEEFDDAEIAEELDKKVLPKWKKYRGIWLAFSSSLIFSLTAVIVKTFNKDDYSSIAISLWRNQGAVWPVFPFLIYHRFIGPKESRRRVFKSIFPLTNIDKLKIFGLLFTRSFLSVNAQLFHFYSLTKLDVGDALVISSSTPIFVTIFAHFFLKEPLGFVPIFTAIGMVLGVVVITRPPFLTGKANFDMEILIGTGLGLSCTILATFCMICLRSIRKVHYTLIILGFGIWGTIEYAIVGYFTNNLSIPNDETTWFKFGGLVVLTFLGQIALIVALKCEAAGPVALIRTCDVIFAFSWQILFFNTIPDEYSVIGALIIVVGVVITTVRKWITTLPEKHPYRLKMRFLLK